MLDSESTPKLQRELELAGEVQRSMLPQTVPSVPGYSFWVYWQPASLVGGDMYNFHTLETGEILLLAADVAGKGIGAAMGMASLAGIVPLVLEQAGSDLTRFMSVLNRSVYRWASRVNRFVTLIAVALDPVANRLRVVNASHDWGVIRRHDGTLENLCPAQQVGMPLGVIDELPYEEMAFELGLGDAVVIFSDGITNATNSSGEAYGRARLNDALAQADPTAAKLGEAILRSLKAFIGGLHVQDDVVLLCFSRDLGQQDTGSA